MKSFYTVGLLIVSNIFMTFAWYGHLKLQQMHISTSWPLIGIIVFSWVITQGDSGSHFPHHLCTRRQCTLPRSEPPLEPLRSFPLPHRRCVFRI